MEPERRLSDLPRKLTRPIAARKLPVIVLIYLSVFFALGPALHAQEVSVDLGTADDFAVLGGTTITNTGATTITGDVGIHPGLSVTGFETVELNGDLHEGDAVAEQAKLDLVTAYDDAANRTVTETIATELGGETLTAGVYDSAAGTFGMTGTLTLDAQDDPNAVFIFQMATTLGTAAASSVSLINGAQACNVFWQVGSSATLGATSSLAGNILALTSITVGAGATVAGRTLARNGAVTLDSNTITRAVCTAAVPEDTTTTLAPEATTTTLAPGATTTTLAPGATTTTLAPGATTTTLAPGATTTTLAPGATTTTLASGAPTASTAPGDTTASGEPTANTLAAPVGGVDSGGGPTSDAPNLILALGGLSLLTVVLGAFVFRRRQDRQSG